MKNLISNIGCKISSNKIIFFSRAICTYLIEKYAKNDSLYPKDPKQRAIINQRLYFDMSSLYQSFAEFFVSEISSTIHFNRSNMQVRPIKIFVIFQYPQVFGGAPADSAKLEKIHEAVAYLEKFLESTNYVAGDHLTVADLVLVTTVSNFEVVKYFSNKFCQLL